MNADILSVMVVLRGLAEAAVLLMIGVVLASGAAAVWVLVGSGSFTHRLAVCLIALGLILGMTGDIAISRVATNDAFAWLGRGPERASDGAAGGRVLTGIGIFLFVGLPLIVIGGLLLA